MSLEMLPKGLIFGSCLCTASPISRNLITMGQYVPENLPKGLIVGSCLCTAPPISRDLITIGQYVPENVA